MWEKIRGAKRKRGTMGTTVKDVRENLGEETTTAERQQSLSRAVCVYLCVCLDGVGLTYTRLATNHS